ncbi:DUF1203 domain-containing protein [Propionibacteriaceae bacterium Y1685]|uniref:DUF1203 domain-containing protein n=1 Tax=Microlunatus sp. Y1700 TaxID=3418487 RepID=UPI003B78D723
MNTATLHAIDADELDEVRTTGSDRAGHRAEPLLDTNGGRQLRCCLGRSEPGETLLLISHAPLRQERPWREIGPVYVHADRCDGYDPATGVPGWLDDAPRVLRAYRADGSMQHPSHRIVEPGQRGGVAAALSEMLREPEVVEVHVRNLREQCFIVRATAVEPG